MAELSTSLCGIHLPNPFILASGPLSFDGAALIRAHRAGAGAVVTKTICEQAARNPMPHIAKWGSSLLNCEKWSDLDPSDWLEREIPIAKEGGATVIASVGMRPANLGRYVASLASVGVDAIEVCSYDADTIVPMVKAAVAEANVPVLAKVSANWPHVTEMAVSCLDAGASGITAIDSLGPTLRLNIEARQPLLATGVGWLTGSAILPFSLRVVADVALATSGAEIVGTGGIHRADDCIEMLMCGATLLGTCSLPMLSGLGVFSRLASSLSRRLDELGYARIQDVVGLGLPALRQCLQSPIIPPSSHITPPEELFSFNRDLCNKCLTCVRVCSYEARTEPNRLTNSRCRLCRLCASACPTGALCLSRRGAPAKADEKQDGKS